MADPVATPPQDTAAQPAMVQFGIEKIYVKDLSLENPGSPQSFQLQEPPQVEVQLRTRTDSIAQDVYESVLTITVTAKSGDKTLFLVEAAQAGIFTIRGVPPEQLQPVLAIHCPTVLFPYARETVADMIARAGFPPIHLAPVNFEAMYAARAQSAQSTGTSPRIEIAH